MAVEVVDPAVVDEDAGPVVVVEAAVVAVVDDSPPEVGVAEPDLPQAARTSPAAINNTHLMRIGCKVPAAERYPAVPRPRLLWPA